MTEKKDNSTLQAKVNLRLDGLQGIDRNTPILETHGGYGKIYGYCYARFPIGVVIEKNPDKASHLAQQRPSWRVYEGETEKALSNGLADDLEFGFIDIDPYGSPFGVLSALLDHPRCLADSLVIAINDGMRQKVKRGGAWTVEALRPVVAEFGNEIYPVYLDVCRWMVEKIATPNGYELSDWRGYYCGHAQGMTHYLVKLRRPGRLDDTAEREAD